MKNQANDFKIVEMALVLDVSVSGYYSYCQRGVSEREKADQDLTVQIKAIFDQNRKAYGRVRMIEALQQQNIHCGERRIARLMKRARLVPKAAKRFKITTKASKTASVKPNRLAQDFTAVKANEKWVSDITYIWTRAGWLYVAVAMDLYSRKIIGLSMGNQINQDLVTRAFLKAMLNRGYPKAVLYHSDQGSQYTARAFQTLMRLYQVTVSMSAKGNCYDNAAMESFFQEQCQIIFGLRFTRHIRRKVPLIFLPLYNFKG